MTPYSASETGDCPWFCGTVYWPRIRPAILGILASFGVLALVAPTVAPSVTFGDSGDLLSAAATLGIAHAPGYPLWCILAHGLWSVSGIPFAVDFLSALALALAGLLAFLAFRELTGDDWAAFGAVLPLCLTPVVWGQAVTAEIYALDLALLTAGLLLVVRAGRRVKDGHTLSWQQALGLGIVLGSGLAYRATHGLFHLAYLVWFVRMPRSQWARRGSVGGLAVGYALALSLWLYIPLRSGAFPWMPFGLGERALYGPGAPIGLSDLPAYVTAANYRGAMWGALPPLWPKLLAYDVRMLAAELSPAVWALAACGLVLCRGKRKVLPLLGLVGMTWLLFWNYLVFDPEAFFIPLYVGVCGLCAFGIAALCERLRRGGRWRRAAWIMPALPLAWLAVQIPSAYTAADRSRDMLADEYVQQLMRSTATPWPVLTVGRRHAIPDHRLLPIEYYRTTCGWMVDASREPQTEDAAYRALLSRLGRPDLAPADLRHRARQLLEVAVADGRVFVMGDFWIENGRGYSDTLGWATRPLLAPAPGLPDPRKGEYWTRWEAHALAVGGSQAPAHEMAVTPLLEVSDELVRYGAAEEALGLIDRGLALDPGNGLLVQAQADVLVGLGRADEAVESLRRARDHAPTFSGWLSMTAKLAQVLVRAERYEEAVGEFEIVLARRHWSPSQELRVRMAAAAAYRVLGRDEDMARVLEPVMDQVLVSPGTE